MLILPSVSKEKVSEPYLCDRTRTKIIPGIIETRPIIDYDYDFILHFSDRCEKFHRYRHISIVRFVNGNHKNFKRKYQSAYSPPKRM